MPSLLEVRSASPSFGSGRDRRISKHLVSQVALGRLRLAYGTPASCKGFVAEGSAPPPRVGCLPQDQESDLAGLAVGAQSPATVRSRAVADLRVDVIMAHLNPGKF